jgi:hypothetical protein
MHSFFNKADKWIGWLLLIIFILIAVNNISWGAPATWHPDEIAIRVKKALNDEWDFDTVNFDYPSLPKHAMYGVGKLATSLGYGDHILESLRLISVVLGGALVALTYKLSRRIGGAPLTSLLAGLFALTCSELLLNSSFAHNDIYLAFFVTLTTFALVKYFESTERIWLYLTCLVIGLAASSKYNGVSLIAVPLFLFVRINFRSILKERLRTIETLVLSIGLFFGGYAIGTPKAATWFAFYAKNAIPAITKHARYGWQPGASNGLILQWGVLNSALGLPLFILVLVSIVFFILEIILDHKGTSEKETEKPERNKLIPILLLVLLAYDIPILLSYNVQPRFFTSMIPILAVLAALFVEKSYRYAKQKEVGWGNVLIVISCLMILLYGGLRSAGVLLSFANDQRIPATEYVDNLPRNIRLEYTLYPPRVNREEFARAHNYPIQFLKFPDQEVPTSPHFEFNTGEVGIEDRKPDYLIVDSFTYARFSEEYVCQIHQADCDFFNRLLAGEANYELVEVFEYDLPRFVPAVNIAFLNPDIRVYQRTTP